MNQSEFELIATKLLDVYGNKFSGTKAELLFESVKSIKASDFEFVVEKVIKSFKFTPSIDEIVELCRPYRARQSGEKCTQCGGSGQLVVYAKETGICYAFACDCVNGNQYPAFPKWHHTKQKYFTRRAPIRLAMRGERNPYAQD